MSKQSKMVDPNYAQEAEKYDDPIPSREHIMGVIAAASTSLSRRDLEDALELTSENHQEALRRRLRAMVRDGQLIQNRQRNYRLIKDLDLLQGKVLGHMDGHGFVKLDNKAPDLFLSPREMRQVFPGDIVAVCEVGQDRRGRSEAKIIEVVKRNTERVVGRVITEQDTQFLIPDNKKIAKDILINTKDSLETKPEQIVVAQITQQPEKNHMSVAVVTEILGEHMAPGLEIEIALRSHNLPHEWPEAVLKAAKTFDVKAPLPCTQERKNLRHLNFVTIDGEDAKDFDDAVYCEPKRFGGYTLYVAIADVGHYVTPGDALDEQAFERGNSVYFPSNVIPMLPEVLSNGLCSLVPHQDRYCMVCEMTITRRGKLSGYKFYPAIIHSKARLTYTQTYGMLMETDKKALTKFGHILEDVQRLYALYQVLHKARAARGAIDFDLPETRIVFGHRRKIKRILPIVRNDAHKLIEECMLMANVATAKFLAKHYKAAMYRNHDTPNVDKLTDLRAFLAELSLSLGGRDTPTAKDYAKLLAKIESRPDKHLIHTVLLRSMMQAEYAPQNNGHFGLAFDGYTHFTSPIRRYPDLIVHRLIKSALHKQTTAYDEKRLSDIAANSSMTERRADDATRDVTAWLKCEYMLDKVGEVFNGIISGVTGFGLFIELNDIYVEGLLHITDLENDYFRFDSQKHRLLGERAGTVYRLGDTITVQVVRVNLDERKIDFALANAPEQASFKKHSKRKRG